MGYYDVFTSYDFRIKSPYYCLILLETNDIETTTLDYNYYFDTYFPKYFQASSYKMYANLIEWYLDVAVNDIRIESNLFLTNAAYDYTICAISQYNRPKNIFFDFPSDFNKNYVYVDKYYAPFFVANNSFIENNATNEIFSIHDVLNVSNNWWNTRNLEEIEAKQLAVPTFGKYCSNLLTSYQNFTTNVSDMFGIRSVDCDDEWSPYRTRCFFRVEASLSFDLANLVCSKLGGTVAAYSNELIDFVGNSQTVWLQDSACLWQSNLIQSCASEKNMLVS